MATWFIRVKHNENLAKEHSIIMIGFGIDRDITMMSDIKIIRNYLENKLNFEPGRVRLDGAQINKFINEVKIGDTIISPFSGGGHRVGEVTNECGTVNSFFQDNRELVAIFDEHVEDEKIKPAIKVKWLTEEMSKTDFPPDILSLLARPMRQTIHSLGLDKPKESTLALAGFINNQRKIEDAKEDTKEQKKINEKFALNTAVTAAITGTSSALAAALVNKMNNYFIAILSILFFTTTLFLLWGLLRGDYTKWFIALWIKMKVFLKWAYACPDHCCCYRCKKD